jgi:hypothetical protein
MEHPMRQFHIAVSLAPRMSERLQKGIIAEPVQLACDGFKADVCHAF